ncbi:MAG: methyltransferase domain-containing protein [Candidatus Schekmanbacteria bacterium]|nr:methyltransferase domain-containing protein [Candidatus Schekmanbacteria bacterium]
MIASRNDIHYVDGGQLFVSAEPARIGTVVGSSVAVCLWDRRRRSGGLAHFTRPFTGDRSQATADYGNVATAGLVNSLMQLGSQVENLEAQVIGGAVSAETDVPEVAHENVRVATAVLRRKRVRIVSQDVGGSVGRKIAFDLASGHVAIIKVRELRHADWWTGVEIAPPDFARLREIVKERSGISLGEQKHAMAAARVNKRMRALGLRDLRDYLAVVEEDRSGQEIVFLLDAISTNVTSFFREPAHFDKLGRVVADWRREGHTRFRIWSAACSTGEEPYTIAVTLKEAGVGSGDDVRILGTDLSTAVLGTAARASFSGRSVENIPVALRDKYFQLQKHSSGDLYVARQQLRELVTVRRLNLSRTPFPMRGPFDVVFCRNVMIYFELDVRTRLINEIFRLLRPGGYLMVGHSESLVGIRHGFRTCEASVFQKP